MTERNHFELGVITKVFDFLFCMESNKFEVLFITL